MIDQLREDLRFVAARFKWPRERVLEVGAAVRKAIESGDQETIKSFSREYAWRRKADLENDPAINRRAAMPQVAAWAKEVCAVFEGAKVTFAMEGGVVLGQRFLSGNEVPASAMVIRCPDQDEALVKRAKRK